jgi:hypothetical protein
MEAMKTTIGRFVPIALITTSALVAIPSRAERKPAHEIVEVSFETGGNTCGGPCADYEVTIRNDGTVTWEGRANVKEVGTKKFSVPRINFERLAHKIHEIGFYDLKDYYGGVEIDGGNMSITDLPTRKVGVIDAAGRRKTIEDYLGAPKKLYELERLIAEVTNASALVGLPKGADDDLPYYDAFPMNQNVTFRGVVSLVRYGGGGAANAPKWTSAYELSLNYAMQFELQAPAGIDLSQLNGWIVDATGKLTKPGVTGEHVFRANKIRRVRKSVDFAPSR